MSVKSRILVVEDEDIIAMDLQSRLETMGYEVSDVAVSGEDAVRRAEICSPDLVLMDIRLKGEMDGIQAAGTIFQRFEIPTVFLTAYVNDDLVDRAKRTHPVGYLLKSVSDQELQSTIELGLYRRDMERRLRESETRYRSLFEQSRDAIVITTPRGSVIDANPAALRLFGYPQKEFMQLQFQSLYVDPADGRLLHREMSRNQSVQGFETRLRRRDGREMVCTFDVVFNEGQNENDHRYQGIIRDVTEQKISEERLRLHRRITMTIRNPMAFVDSRYCYAMVNEAYAQRYGVKTQDLIGKSVAEVVGRAFFEKEVRHRFEECGAGRNVGFEAWREYPGIGRRFMEMAYYPHFDAKGKVVGIVTQSRDATDRVAALAASRESEEKFRMLFDASPMAMGLTDLKTGRIVDANQQLCALSKYGRDELVGKTTSELNFYSAEKRKDVLEELQRSGRVDALEVPVSAKDGTPLTVHMYSRRIHLSGKPYAVSMFVDVTRQKRLEARLSEIRKMEAVGTLAGGIAHDYNNLLAVILGNLSLAKNVVPPGEKSIGGFLESAEDASLKARDLTRELMAFCRGSQPVKEVSAIGELLKDTVATIRTEDRVVFDVAIAPDLPVVDIDVDQISSALRNILINAVEALPEGGTVTIRAENLHVDKKNNDSSLPLTPVDYVRVSVQDSGVGIAAEYLPNIFDPYFSTKERGAERGMGLGLAIAYAIIRKHEGHIAVDSRRGKGTNVILYIPLGKKPFEPVVSSRAKSPSPPVRARRSSQRRKVLVMDDEEMVRELTAETLKRLGYETMAVRDGEKAITAYRAAMDTDAPFDVVLLDLTVKGGMGGKEAMAELRRIDSGVKAIVCSGYFEDGGMGAYAAWGFRAAIAKPYKATELADLLEEVLGEADQR